MTAEVLANDPEQQRSSEPGAEFRWPSSTALPHDEHAPALLTIDVEDYFHVAAFRGIVRREDWGWYPSRVEGNVSRLLDLCDEFGVRGTWFVLGWEAQRHPAMVRRIAERGHEVGCHSFWHREIYNLSPDEFRADTLQAKNAIEDACGQSVAGYRAPSFSITRASLWALEILSELGFRYDSSIFPVSHPDYGIPDAPFEPHRIRCGEKRLWELPPATTAMFGRRLAVAGGGYLRHFPSSLIRAGLHRLTRVERQPAVLYLHPWEIDPDQPRLAARMLTRVRHYRHLDATEPRLRRLLPEFAFTTCAQLVDRLEVGRTTARERARANELALMPVASGTAAASGEVLTAVERLWLDGFRRWGRGWLSLLGVSMLPTLKPGDRVLVEKTGEPLRSGDIGVFFNGRRLIVHRVLGAIGTGSELRYVESGDATGGWSVRSNETVVGRVTAVERDGITRPVEASPLKFAMLGKVRSAWLRVSDAVRSVRPGN